MRGIDVSGSEDPWEGVKEKLHAYISAVQEGFGGRIIKRNENSVRFDGKPLNEALPPFKQIVATCRLTQQEMEILEQELVIIADK
jgi:hypothetical protein